MERRKVVVDLQQIDLLETRIVKAAETIRSLRRERDTLQSKQTVRWSAAPSAPRSVLPGNAPADHPAPARHAKVSRATGTAASCRR